MLTVLVAVAVPVPDDGGGYIKSEYFFDSPQHVIKPANYRNSVADVELLSMQPAGRLGKSQEMTTATKVDNESDGQLMYVVIKPAPVVRKYSPDNRALHMEGVRNNETRMPRLNLASGAYPVFYSIASANGKFGRNIRALTKEEISRATAKTQ